MSLRIIVFPHLHHCASSQWYQSPVDKITLCAARRNIKKKKSFVLPSKVSIATRLIQCCGFTYMRACPCLFIRMWISVPPLTALLKRCGRTERHNRRCRPFNFYFLLSLFLFTNLYVCSILSLVTFSLFSVAPIQTNNHTKPVHHGCRQEQGLCQTSLEHCLPPYSPQLYFFLHVMVLDFLLKLQAAP